MTKTWDMVHSGFKQSNSFNDFKRSVRKWIPAECPYRVCNTYFNGVGFILNFSLKVLRQGCLLVDQGCLFEG